MREIWGHKNFLSLNLVIRCPLQFEERSSSTMLSFMCILEQLYHGGCSNGQKIGTG